MCLKKVIMIKFDCKDILKKRNVQTFDSKMLQNCIIWDKTCKKVSFSVRFFWSFQKITISLHPVKMLAGVIRSHR